MIILLNKHQSPSILSYIMLKIMSIKQNQSYLINLNKVLYFIVNLQIYWPLNHFLIKVIMKTLHFFLLFITIFRTFIRNIPIFHHSSIPIIPIFIHCWVDCYLLLNSKNQKWVILFLIHWCLVVRLEVVRINSIISKIIDTSIMIGSTFEWYYL